MNTDTAAWCYGAAWGLLAALLILLPLLGSTPPDGDARWNLLVACGFASLIALSAMSWLASASGSARLPASFFHAYHVYLGRLVVGFAILHAVALIVLEPILLSDLQPFGALWLLAGAGSLAALTLLAMLPWRDCRAIHDRASHRAGHALLALLAAVLALVHVFARDYRGVGWQRWLWLLLLGGAAATQLYRRLSRRAPQAQASDRAQAQRARPLARRALSMSALMAVAALFVYARWA